MDSKRATVQHRDKVGKKKNTVERDTVTQTVLQTMSSRQIPLKFTSNYSLVPSADSRSHVMQQSLVSLLLDGDKYQMKLNINGVVSNK